MTLDQLKRRGFSLANRFPLCGMDEENVEHLLIHCPEVWGTWTSILATMGITWVPPYFVRDLLAGWRKISVKEERKIGVVRRERNRMIFENEDFSLSRLKSSFDYLLHSWASWCVNSESRFVVFSLYTPWIAFWLPFFGSSMTFHFYL